MIKDTLARIESAITRIEASRSAPGTDCGQSRPDPAGRSAPGTDCGQSRPDPAGGSRDKAELVALLNKLKSELAALPPERVEEARSIGRFTEAAAHEATREEASPRLKELSIEGAGQAVKGFEATHPTLVGVVNEICMILARMGI